MDMEIKEMVEMAGLLEEILEVHGTAPGGKIQKESQEWFMKT